MALPTIGRLPGTVGLTRQAAIGVYKADSLLPESAVFCGTGTTELREQHEKATQRYDS